MSLRSGHVTLLGVCLLCAFVGCGHLLESRAITDFTYAMQEQDLAYLRESHFERFQTNRLRRTEALEDLKILRLPQDPPSIVNVIDISPTEKQVTVTKNPDSKGPKQSQLLYKLTRTDKNSTWVVDDIYIKRKQRAQGHKVRYGTNGPVADTQRFSGCLGNRWARRHSQSQHAHTVTGTGGLAARLSRATHPSYRSGIAEVDKPSARSTTRQERRHRQSAPSRGAS